MKKILVVILNYRTYKMTLNLIKELNYLDTSLFDILVIDNCSKNESADILLLKTRQIVGMLQEIILEYAKE